MISALRVMSSFKSADDVVLRCHSWHLSMMLGSCTSEELCIDVMTYLSVYQSKTHRRREEGVIMTSGVGTRLRIPLMAAEQLES